MKIMLFIISFIASSIGSICGIGGGIIIKPALDFAKLVSLPAIGFYSCCTVFSMSAYNVLRSVGDKTSGIEGKTGTLLAIGAAIGGVLGNRLFAFAKSITGNDGSVGAVQSILLLILTLGTLIYTLNKKKIVTKSIKNKLGCTVIGLALGCISSFLGIGGGPFNLVVLHFFFGMDTKKAVTNSLYIILLSQIANMIMYFVSGSVPEIDNVALLLMAVGGVSGGILGREFGKKNSSTTVDKLFIGLMIFIIFLCIYNAYKYLSFI